MKRSHLIAKVGGYTLEKSRLIERDKLTAVDVFMFIHNISWGLTEAGKTDLKVVFNGKTVYENGKIVKEAF